MKISPPHTQILTPILETVDVTSKLRERHGRSSWIGWILAFSWWSIICPSISYLLIFAHRDIHSQCGDNTKGFWSCTSADPVYIYSGRLSEDDYTEGDSIQVCHQPWDSPGHTASRSIHKTRGGGGFGTGDSNKRSQTKHWVCQKGSIE